MTDTATAPKGINVPNVTAWMTENIEGVEAANGPLTFTMITGGHSNLTYKAEDANGKKFVLRRPPTGAVLATAHDMGREYKIISGVGKTKVPVPPALGLCTDESVNDAPFYVMGYVEGQVVETATTSQDIFDMQARGRVGASLIEVIANLHMVNPDDVGLGDLGRKEAYLSRQIRRWTKQWEGSKTKELPLMEEVGQGLTEKMPEQLYTGIVHGDYRIGNTMTTPDGEIAAVLDWELCTLGDTMADLGYIANDWSGRWQASGTPESPNEKAAEGYKSLAELTDLYSELTGRDVTDVNYYRAFQCWRLAAIVQGVLARYLKGVMGQEMDVTPFEIRVEALAKEAATLLG